MATRVIICDFDGVIVDSEGLKQDAYRLMFSEFGENIPEDAVCCACEKFADGRGNRFDVIREILLEENRLPEIRAFVERYDQVVRSRFFGHRCYGRDQRCTQEA